MKLINKLQFFTLLILAGFCAMAGAKPNMTNHYDESNTNILVTVRNPVFMIKLKSNPTTGYSWILKTYDPKLINLMSHRYVRPATNLIGASGYELWTFSAQQKLLGAKTTIQLLYARPWQPNVNNKSLVFTVNMTK